MTGTTFAVDFDCSLESMLRVRRIRDMSGTSIDESVFEAACDDSNCDVCACHDLGWEPDEDYEDACMCACHEDEG